MAVAADVRNRLGTPIGILCMIDDELFELDQERLVELAESGIPHRLIFGQHSDFAMKTTKVLEKSDAKSLVDELRSSTLASV